MHENVFRLDAGPEVEAAWASMGINCEHIFHTTLYLKDMRDLQYNRQEFGSPGKRGSRNRFAARSSQNQREIRWRVPRQR
jgi:hypothetical protein